MRIALLCLLALVALPTQGHAQVPVFKTTPQDSSIKFFVKASVALTGNFDKWDATLKFKSPDVTTGVLDIKIQATTLNTGSGMKDKKLRSKDFFFVDENPLITFHSTKVVQTGPTTFDVLGNFSIRGVSKPETLKLDVTGKGTGQGLALARSTIARHSGRLECVSSPGAGATFRITLPAPSLSGSRTEAKR